MAIPEADLRLGDRFTDLRIEHAGGRFTVLHAVERHTSQPVVIKTPAPSTGSWLDELLDREAEILAALADQPHVVNLRERTARGDGRPVLVLEPSTRSLADGFGSDDPGGDGRLAVEAAASLGIKLAAALEAVHGLGIAHCDVRPRNVLVDAAGEPRLASFTETLALDADPGTASHVTTAHTAPELLEGGPATARTDVYGLGSTLYELVAGRGAFRAYAGESPATVIVRVLSNRAAPIVAPGIPLAMSDLLTWAMSPNPTARPPGPSWLGEELTRIQRDQGWPRTTPLPA